MHRTAICLAIVASLALAGCGGEEEGGGEVTGTTEGQTAGGGSTEATDDSAASGMVDDGDTSLPGDADAGEATYTRICVACHAADGRGNGGLTAADFIGDGARLAKGNNVLLNSIENGIINGGRVMPAQGAVLDEQERKDVLSYIRREFGATD